MFRRLVLLAAILATFSAAGVIYVTSRPAAGRATVGVGTAEAQAVKKSPVAVDEKRKRRKHRESDE